MVLDHSPLVMLDVCCAVVLQLAVERHSEGQSARLLVNRHLAWLILEDAIVNYWLEMTGRNACSACLANY